VLPTGEKDWGDWQRGKKVVLTKEVHSRGPELNLSFLYVWKLKKKGNSVSEREAAQGKRGLVEVNFNFSCVLTSKEAGMPLGGWGV